jgi:TonB family protein
MSGPMQPDASPETPLAQGAKSRALEFGVDWESPWQVFRTSVRDVFWGPRLPKERGAPESPVLRVEWIRSRLPGRALGASCLWHAAAVLILRLPIWSFLPSVEQNLAPVQIESTLYFRPENLPRISPPKSSPKRGQLDNSSKPPAERGADAYEPRQTILSIPARVSHPRQTLIEPDAPPTPPKVEPQLPNIVEWWTAARPVPTLRLAPATVAPRIEPRAIREILAPDVANNEKNIGPLNVASTPAVNLQPQMPVSPMSRAKAGEPRPHPDAARAPEIDVSAGDSNLQRLIALSAMPGPPAAQVTVPEGNLSARIAISPEGTRPGAPGGPERGGTDSGARSGLNPGSTAGLDRPGGDADSLRAAVSVSGASGHSAGGGIETAPSHADKLNLKPAASSDLPTTSRKGPALLGAIEPGLPPEAILAGKEIYTMDVNMPNLTSVTGSWILSFAELDQGDGPPYRGPRIRLSSPVAVEKVDPLYPPTLIEEHVDGEVVLYAIIRKDGSVDSIQVVRKLDPQLDRNAIEALAHWKFRPAARDGAPVDLEAVVHIPFRFRRR